MSDTKVTCAECGALIRPCDTECPLCGTPVGSSNIDAADEDLWDDSAVPAGRPQSGQANPAPRGVFCHQCGWQNPPGARFCSSCGTKLQQLHSPIPLGSGAAMPSAQDAASRPAASPNEVNRRIAIIVGAAVLLVMALFLITVVSKGRLGRPAAGTASSDTTVVGDHQSLPLEPTLARQVDSLTSVIDRAGDPQKLALRADLVNLFIRNGRLDRAAMEQEKIAGEMDTAEAWKKTGDLYFDWMETIQGDHKTEVSRLSVAAYRKVLEKQPDNLDVKTDMAWAYQYDPGNGMQAITLTNEVLQKNPNHLQANFNKGIFLIQVNRLDQALQQFEKVKTIAGSGTPEAERASAAINAVKDMQSRATTGS